jgi:hypothetical protein
MSAAGAAEALLMFAVVPLWIAAGLVDWACHRRTGIERTSGWPESVFHWILFAQGGVVLLAAAFLEVTAGVLLLVSAAFLAHEATAWIELRQVVPLREVRPAEQMVHSFMEILPLAVLALLAVIAWDQARALFGAGVADFDLRAKALPWPPAYLLAAGASVLAFNALPLAEEAVRCLRARR